MADRYRCPGWCRVGAVRVLASATVGLLTSRQMSRGRAELSRRSTLVAAFSPVTREEASVPGSGRCVKDRLGLTVAGTVES